MHPSLLFSVLRERHAELANIRDVQLHRFADVMMRTISPGLFRHELAGSENIPEDAIALSCRYLEREFGRGGFHRINNIARCFGASPGWYMQRGLTRLYWLSVEGHEVIRATLTALQEGQESFLVNKNGGRLRRKANGVYTARDIEGRNAVTDAVLNSLVPLNMDAINNAIGDGVARIFPEVSPERALRAENQLRALQMEGLSSQFGRGVLPQKYKESNAGRLCGQGGLSLQNVMTEVRRVVLAGSFEYDFENCHYQFLNHYANQHGIDAPRVRDYAQNPAGFRQQAGERIGISPSQVKRALLAILNGAPRGRSYRNSLPEIVGVENIQRFYGDPILNELTFEITEIGERMRMEATVLEDGTVENCRGKRLNGNNGQKLAHLLQGLESELLHVVIHEYRDRILIIQHDGWTMTEYVDPREIEAMIERVTGIRMPLRVQQLG